MINSIENFNNLQKLLSLNIYFYSKDNNEKWLEDINNKFSNKNLSNIIKKISHKIDAIIVNTSNEDFEPYGNSQFVLLKNKDINLHLNKSHISLHTYYDFNNKNWFYRIDIDVSTCGLINPLLTLNYILKSFEPDFIEIDFFIRGFMTEDKIKYLKNKKDLKILNFIKKKYLCEYKYNYKTNEKKRYSNFKFIKKDIIDKKILKIYNNL